MTKEFFRPHFLKNKKQTSSFECADSKAESCGNATNTTSLLAPDAPWSDGRLNVPNRRLKIVRELIEIDILPIHVIHVSKGKTWRKDEKGSFDRRNIRVSRTLAVASVSFTSGMRPESQLRAVSIFFAAPFAAQVWGLSQWRIALSALLMAVVPRCDVFQVAGWAIDYLNETWQRPQRFIKVGIS